MGKSIGKSWENRGVNPLVHVYVSMVEITDSLLGKLRIFDWANWVRSFATPVS